MLTIFECIFGTLSLTTMALTLASFLLVPRGVFSGMSTSTSLSGNVGVLSLMSATSTDTRMLSPLSGIALRAYEAVVSRSSGRFVRISPVCELTIRSRSGAEPTGTMR